MGSLPRWAKVYLAARCARRALQLIDAPESSGELSDLLTTLRSVEEAAQRGIPVSDDDRSPARRVADRVAGSGASRSPLALAALSVDDAYGLASRVAEVGRRGVSGAADYQLRKLQFSISSALQAAEKSKDPSRRARLHNAIAADLSELSHVFSTSDVREGAGVGPETLAVRLSFNTDSQIAGNSILELRSRISEELIARLAKEPALLYDLTSRAFEELIARVFENYGFTVELTAPVRDGGRDIIAVAHAPASMKYLVECKRYSPTNRVGIEIVQRLHGVVAGEDATMGILATTSTFTKPATDFLVRPNVRYRLDGRDFHSVMEWLTSYDRVRMARQVLGTGFIVSASGLVVPA
jgi:hypothetical protein